MPEVIQRPMKWYPIYRCGICKHCISYKTQTAEIEPEQLEDEMAKVISGYYKDKIPIHVPHKCSHEHFGLATFVGFERV